jgi:uncharacterized protein
MSAGGEDNDGAVRHEAGARRFVVRLADGEAELGYDATRPGTLELHHTFVPESARGRGVGERLVTAAMDHARETGVKIIPTCPFVRSWVEEHPEVRDLISR